MNIPLRFAIFAGLVGCSLVRTLSGQNVESSASSANTTITDSTITVSGVMTPVSTASSPSSATFSGVVSGGTGGFGAFGGIGGRIGGGGGFGGAAVGGGGGSYGSGRFPMVQRAFAPLEDALNNLNVARISDKGTYLARAIQGVQMAIADTKLIVDHADGSPTPAPSALPDLPTGLGNPSSPSIALPPVTSTTSPPELTAALASLTQAVQSLNGALPGAPGSARDFGIFIDRARNDTAFAAANAQAAINTAGAAPAPVPAPAAASALPQIDLNELGLGLLVIVVLIAIGVEQTLRKRLGR